MDSAIETSLRNRTDSLHLDAYDTASQTPVARVAYPMRNLTFTSCRESSSENPDCSIPGTNGTIMFVTFDQDEATVLSDATRASIVLDTVPKVTYDQSIGLSLAG
jgi:hypothetical protein